MFLLNKISSIILKYNILSSLNCVRYSLLSVYKGSKTTRNFLPILIITSSNNQFFTYIPFIFFGLLLAIAMGLLVKQFKENSILKRKLSKADEENSLFVNQIELLHKDIINGESEYNHLFQLNTINLLELEKAKKDYLDAKRIAEESDMLKSNFLANMSHEIRTPMNGILGFAQLLQDDDLDRDMQHRYLDIVCHNGAMLVNLIDDIMDISKIEVGQLAFNKAEVNIDDLIFDLYTFFNEIKFKQEKEHLTLRLLNLNDDENSMFFTDEQRLRQVLSNLIGNSIKFTDKGSVEFGYINNKEEQNLQFFVRDTGIGIPPDKRNIIFERFRQIEEGSTRKYGGTGIGLYISKHIIELLGGRIWVESEEGHGSSFYFTLPYATVQEREGTTKVFTPADRNYDWEGKTIVIAEDVETNYRFLKAILEKTNAEIVWTRNGEEVVKYCKENPTVDMVLMDIQMPKIDGYEATTLIKGENPNIKIIAQTAYAMPNDNIKCIEAGCNDYISKPINSHILLEKINTHLSNNKLKVL
jgi:signal transduction histidine kinase/ActR/RegA family two-component response regulator